MTAPADDGFVHPALFYRTDEDYLAALVPFAVDGLAADQPVAVAVPGRRLDLVRDGLGGHARHVTLLDMAREGRNPGRIIARVLRRFADRHRDRRVRIVGEPVWAGRTDQEYPACAQHEALINTAFTGRDVTILCPYDVSALDDRALADARATHPEIWEGARRLPSDRYAPDAVVARYNEPFPDAGEVVVIAVTADLAPARRAAARWAAALGLPADRVPDLELIVTELTTNGLRHTDGPCRLSVRREHDRLVCEVRDTGRLADPLAGRRPAEPGQRSGRGLLLVNDLADLVRVHTGAGGTTVRVVLDLGARG
ncbi:anti-sigma factor RsbA family regulatory protein [Saccharothrix algeriensis]|uniref:Anti-sigma regulatory factor (Ser/Thr protein kinase) n=1 Tax=Saccharothrix algeriensis TaxID=173560 RepID=A0A8T8I0M1_9PSEU|nr:anti-sigma factor RsbA family regulatory protein [Saccharothrix algeriensis]MBM7809974.1 anti-sigma regulatory factor (Ser/Thr protein kinase) [Saccharothrix algeriensis]QTR04217.1 MEDS domain-containing protein [Saccharothrix algeriensis]